MRPPRTGEVTTLRLFYAADIHGSDRCFRKFLNAAKFYQADVLILGGDLTGKAFVPIVEEEGVFTCTFLGRTDVATGDAELEEMEKRIGFNGFYPVRCSAEELGELENDPKFRGERLGALMRAAIEDWMRLVDSRLADTDTVCVLIPGNDDPDWIRELFQTSSRVVDADEQVIEVADFQLLSLGYSNPTPWHTQRELSEQDLEARLDLLTEEVGDPGQVVLNVHVPPFASGLDLAPEIRSDLTLVGGARARSVPVGSTAVLQMIEKLQPVLGLHGHIHESRGVVRVGETVCVNPGSEYNAGILRGAIVDIERGRKPLIQLVAA